MHFTVQFLSVLSSTCMFRGNPPFYQIMVLYLNSNWFWVWLSLHSDWRFCLVC